MIEKSFFDEENFFKIIYLDSDTVVNLDIAELWNYSIENRFIAAVPEIDATRHYMMADKYVINTGKVTVEDYLCSGVVILNFDKIEENFFYTGINWLAENQNCECPDQDILNNFFSKNYLKLPEKFNAFVSVCKVVDGNNIYEKIYHYAGRGFLGMTLQSEHNKLFLSYFSKTPWFNVNIFEGIYQAAKDMRNEKKIFGYQVSTIMNGKKRVFFTFSKNAELVKNYFDITNRNDLFVLNETDSLEILAKMIKKNKKNTNIFWTQQILYRIMIRRIFLSCWLNRCNVDG